MRLSAVEARAQVELGSEKVMFSFFRHLAPALFVGVALVAPALMHSNHAIVWAQEVAATSYAPAFGWNGDMGQYVTE